jgi:hypothetical protein
MIYGLSGFLPGPQTLMNVKLVLSKDWFAAYPFASWG